MFLQSSLKENVEVNWTDVVVAHLLIYLGSLSCFMTECGSASPVKPMALHLTLKWSSEDHRRA